MSKSRYFSHVAVVALAFALGGGLATAASAQQSGTQGGGVTSCAEGQALGSDQRCYNEVKIFQTDVKDKAEIDRILRNNGWRLATPSEVTFAWGKLGLNTNSFYMLSDGTNAVPAQQDDGPALKRGVNLRGRDLPTFLVKGFFYVKMNAPALTVATGDVTITQITPAPATQVATVPVPQNNGCPAGQSAITTTDGALVCEIPLIISSSGSDPFPVGPNPIPLIDPNQRRSGPVLAYMNEACAWEGPVNFMLDGWNGPERELLVTAKSAFLQDSSWKVMNLPPAEVERRLKTDAKFRWKFAPFMIEAAWNALRSENRTAAQTAFVNRFGKWSGCDKSLTAGGNLFRWLQFKGSDLREFMGGNIPVVLKIPPKEYKPMTLSVLTFTGPSFSSFDASNGGNPLYIGPQGQAAIATLVKPAFIKAILDMPDLEGLRFVDEDFRSLTARVGVGLESKTPIWQLTGKNFIDKGVFDSKAYNTYESVADGTNVILSLLGANLSLPTEQSGSPRGIIQQSLTLLIANLVSAIAPKVGDVLGSGGLSFAAAILEAKLTDVINKAKYEEALRRDAGNIAPVPIIPSKLGYDVNRNGFDGPVQADDIERAAIFALLLKFLIGVPGDSGSLSLTVPTPDCPVGLVSKGAGCVADIRFHRQLGITLEEAQAIAAREQWVLATPEAVAEFVRYAALPKVAGLVSSGGQLSTINYASVNQGFFYIPGLKTKQPGQIIQSAADMSILVHEKWIIRPAWVQNPNIYDFGDQNDPKFNTYTLENATTPGEYGYLDGSEFRVGRLAPNDPRAIWRIISASKGFSWIKPYTLPEYYLQYKNLELAIGYSEPENKGALWYTGGVGLAPRN